MWEYLPVAVFTGLLLTADVASPTGRALADSGTEARRAIRRVTAAAAMEKLLASDQLFRVPADQLVRVIQKDPQTHDKPNLQDVQDSQRARFSSILAQARRGVTVSLDPDGTLELDAWLSQHLRTPRQGKKESLESLARSRHEDYLSRDKGLREVYQKARQLVVTAQLEEIRRSLKDKHWPDVKEIEDVHRDPRQRSGMAASLAETMMANRRLISETRREVLAIAEQRLSLGLSQLKSQFDALKAEAKSRSLEGIVAELNDRVDKVRAAMKRQPDQKVYDVFPCVRQAIQQCAGNAFGGHILGAIGAITAEIKQGNYHKTFRQIIVASIEKAPQEHAAREESQKLLRQSFEPFLQQSGALISRRVQQAAEANPSSFDTPEGLGRIPDHVNEELNGDLRPRWKGLSDTMLDDFQDMIPAVRGEIAQREAVEVCRALGKGQWRPSEQLILACDPDALDRRGILAFPFWNGSPPARFDVLEETWEIWVNLARQTVAAGRQAVSLQLWLVDDLEQTMVSRIRKDPGLGSVHWTNEFTEQVVARWQEQTDPSAARYPGLFNVTKEKILGIVTKTLLQGAKDIQHGIAEQYSRLIQEAIAKDRLQGNVLHFEPYYRDYVQRVHTEWKKHPLSNKHSDLFPEVDERIRGKVQQWVRAEVELLKDIAGRRADLLDGAQRALDQGQIPNPGEFAATLRSHLEAAGNGQALSEAERNRQDAIVKQARVLYEQNKLVTQLQPPFEMDVVDRLAAGEDVALQRAIDSYQDEVKGLWKHNRLAVEFPELLPSVRERIDGIVSQLLKADRPRIKELAIEKQKSLVEKHRKQITREIDQDPEPGRRLYEDKYVRLVKQDWTTDESYRSLRKHFPDVLPDIRLMIQGIVSELIPETEPQGSVRPESARPSYDPRRRSTNPSAKGSSGSDATDLGSDSSSGGGGPGRGTSTGGAGANAGGGGAGSGGGTGDAMVPEPTKGVPLWFLLLLILFLLLLIALCYDYWRRRKSGSGAGQERNTDFELEMLIRRLMPLFREFVALYREEAELHLRRLVAQKKGLRQPLKSAT